MIVIKAITITIGLILIASESAGNICNGRWNGDQLPNSEDCGSFYVCNFGEPKLFKCLDNLLYDPVKRVCNWAYLVTCGQTTGNQEHVPILPNPPYYPQPQPEIHPEEGYIYPGTPRPTQPQYYPTNAPVYTANPPPIVDNPNVPNYSETTEFYPGLVESIPNVFHCTNPEFYFAPHPRNCEKYFICENYRIHSHQCAEGIHWDYVFNQCDFPVRTFCYAGPYAEGDGVNINGAEHIESPVEEHVEEHENFEEHEHVEEPEHVEESVEEHVEESVKESVEEHIDEVVEEHVEEPVEEHVEEPVEEPVEEHIEEHVEPATIPDTVAPTEAEPSTAAPLPVIECPGTQAFIAHPSDCHKYYICIGGIPIVTSCPRKMAWDKEMAQCNEESWTQCFGLNLN